MIAEEISPIFFGILIGYFGGRTHRPRFIAIAMTIGFLSSFVLSLPYFLYGAIRDSSSLDHYKNATEFELCDLSEKNYFCDKFPTFTAVSIFFVGTLMKGFACNAFYTVGTPYLDDNVKKKNTAMYFATSMIIQLMGPAFGFLLSSFSLQFYEDPFYDPGYGSDDPRWIGAWWMGYVILGSLMFTCSLPMWLFPRRFPGVKLPKAITKKKESSSVSETLKNLGNALKRLVRNPILLCHQLGGVLRTNGTLGYFVLMPKYMEMQFKQSASKANLFSGPITIVGMQFGILLGGILVRKFMPRARILTGGLVFAESFGMIALLIAMQITCPATYDSKTSETLLNLDNECNRGCLCTTKEYTPICGPDEITTYFSPCHAGCSDYNSTGDKEIYTDCHCLRSSENNFTTGTSTKGYCVFECNWLIVYILIMSIGKFLSSTTSVPNALVLLRCVNPEDKSVALGALSGFYSILAFLPFPLVYGAISDYCCLVWEQSCGKTGNCWIYDIDKFRFMLHGVSFSFLFCGSCLDVLVWYLSPRLKNLYADEDQSETKIKMNTITSSNMEPSSKSSTTEINTKVDIDTNQKNNTMNSDTKQQVSIDRIDEDNNGTENDYVTEKKENNYDMKPTEQNRNLKTIDNKHKTNTVNSNKNQLKNTDNSDIESDITIIGLNEDSTKNEIHDGTKQTKDSNVTDTENENQSNSDTKQKKNSIASSDIKHNTDK